MFRKIGILVLVASTSFFYDCKKKATTVVQDNIAYQSVNIIINISDPLYNSLQYAGSWLYINGGVNGIIIYRKTVTSTPADFIALERTSTYLPDDPAAKVDVLTDNFTLKDAISGSKWQIFDGTVISGPATQNLRIYNTLFDGLNTVTIRN
jgi:hypothetical protein